jgi:hypothetical protein
MKWGTVPRGLVHFSAPLPHGEPPSKDHMSETSQHIRKTLLTAALLLCAASARAEQKPHPAVARIIVPDGTGVSFGSGTLVDVGKDYGLVITNWHVVRDSSDAITVLFPDGFASKAKLLRVDRDWDLAVLSIRRPKNIEPVPLSSTVPRRGDVLAIAGWGKGSYRASAGRCTQYLSPGGNHPFEMIELTTTARNGDSGGPIFNQRGELAGVLFGSASGRTTGSYCGRVRWFLATVDRKFQHPAPRLPAPYRPPVASEPTMIAQRPQQPIPVAAIGTISAVHPSAVAPEPVHQRPVASSRQLPPPSLQRAPAYVAQPTPPMPSAQPVATLATIPELPTRGDQLKTILAGIGIVFILFHGLRLVGSLQQ